MDTQGGGISESSRRIARNTILLYFRMGLMILIGLFTYRVILRSLGITDYGVYNAVGGVVTMFMLVMNTVVSAISRYITVGLGKGDMARLRIIFGTSLAVMAGFCLLIIILTETVGLWYLGNKMVIPPERMHAAHVVLQTSMLVLLVNLLSIPFTADINAHEHMGAYAVISILEAILKLGVAAAVWFSSADKLVVYAWMLVLVALLSRGAYAAYAMVRFPESRIPWKAEGSLVREMGAFAGWNFLGSGAYMLNTQGINQLMNLFFGVGANAARGVADKVEQVVRQFATNIALALNPALTKAYVGGNKEYAYELVCKGSKYYFWILWTIALPFFTDADTILALWLGADIPQEAAFFTKLTLLCFVIDFTPGTLNVLVQAGGRIRRYYIWTSLVASLAFPITYVAYRLGAPAWSGYVAFFGIYIVKSVIMMLVAQQETGLQMKYYFRKGIWPALAPGLMSLLVISFIPEVLPAQWWRFLVTASLGCITMATSIWQVGLTEGEKSFVMSKLPWQGK